MKTLVKQFHSHVLMIDRQGLLHHVARRLVVKAITARGYSIVRK